VNRGAGFDFDAMQAQGDDVGLQLYLLIMTPLPLASTPQAPSPGQPSPLEIHYAYMHELIEQGKVLLIGPCMAEPVVPGHAPVPHGFGILRVSSLEEAEEIARNEPFGVMGWRRNTVMAWTPKFGSLIPTLISTIGQ
jgi:uncharacterized protein YciI